MRQNAIWNCKNPYQGEMPKVLCVCSAGLLRSPTVAWILSNEGYNTRAVGVHDYALVPVDEVLIEWADHILCMEHEHMQTLFQKFPNLTKTVVVLDVPDRYAFRDPELVQICRDILKDEGFIDPENT